MSAQLESTMRTWCSTLDDGATRLDAQLDRERAGAALGGGGDAAIAAERRASRHARIRRWSRAARSIAPRWSCVSRTPRCGSSAGSSRGAFGRVAATGERRARQRRSSRRDSPARAPTRRSPRSISPCSPPKRVSRRASTGRSTRTSSPKAARIPAWVCCAPTPSCARRSSPISPSRRCACAARSTPGRAHSRSRSCSRRVPRGSFAATRRAAASAWTAPSCTPTSSSSDCPRAGSARHRSPVAFRSTPPAAARSTIRAAGSTSTEPRCGGRTRSPGRLALRATALGSTALRLDTLLVRVAGPRDPHVPSPRRSASSRATCPPSSIETFGLAFPGGSLHARGRISSAGLAGVAIDLDERDLAVTAAAFGLDASGGGRRPGPRRRRRTARAPGAVAARSWRRRSPSGTTASIASRRAGSRCAAHAGEAQLIDGGVERLAASSPASRATRSGRRAAPAARARRHRSADPRRTRSTSRGSRRRSGASRTSCRAASTSMPSRAARRPAPLVTGSLRLAEGRVAAKGSGRADRSDRSRAARRGRRAAHRLDPDPRRRGRDPRLGLARSCSARR